MHATRFVRVRVKVQILEAAKQKGEEVRGRGLIPFHKTKGAERHCITDAIGSRGVSAGRTVPGAHTPPDRAPCPRLPGNRIRLFRVPCALTQAGLIQKPVTLIPGRGDHFGSSL